MIKRERPEGKRASINFVVKSPEGVVHGTMGFYPDGRLAEIFLDASKEGTFSQAMMHAFAMAVSIGLQHQVPLSAYLHTFKNYRSDTCILAKIMDVVEEECLSYEKCLPTSTEKS